MAQSFETVFIPLRASAVEFKGMAISLETSMPLQVTHKHENVPPIFAAIDSVHYGIGHVLQSGRLPAGHEQLELVTPEKPCNYHPCTSSRDHVPSQIIISSCIHCGRYWRTPSPPPRENLESQSTRTPVSSADLCTLPSA